MNPSESNDNGKTENLRVEGFRTSTPTTFVSATDECPDLQNLMLEQEYQENIINFMREIQSTAEEPFPSTTSHGYDSGTDSDAQDKQATEAADTDPPIDTHKDPVDSAIDESLHSEACPADVVCSSMHEIPPAEENIALVISDVENLCLEKSTGVSPSSYRESFCVPYMNNGGEVNEEKSVLTETMTTTTVIIESSEPKKKHDDLGHIMISYNHSTKALCMRIAQLLRNSGYCVWIDQDNITGDVLISMASAVENAFVVLMAVNDEYYQSRYCRLEAEYAVERNKATIPMLMQAGYNPVGWLGLINGAKLYVDFVQFPFDQAFNRLIREIETIRVNLGAEKNTRLISSSTQYYSTTIDYSLNTFRPVQQWTSDEVMEWLHRERLEIFQRPFAHFTGETLRQLYKIRLDCPTHYFQTIESLLDASVPLRLFYNLSLNGALESLFASTISSFPFQNKH